MTGHRPFSGLHQKFFALNFSAGRLFFAAEVSPKAEMPLGGIAPAGERFTMKACRSVESSNSQPFWLNWKSVPIVCQQSSRIYRSAWVVRLSKITCPVVFRRPAVHSQFSAILMNTEAEPAERSALDEVSDPDGGL